VHQQGAFTPIYLRKRAANDDAFSGGAGMKGRLSQ